MKLTETQALVMFDVLKQSLAIQGGFAGYSRDTLEKTVSDILNQQDKTLVELGGLRDRGKQ